MNNKIIRSICYFDKEPSDETIERLDKIAGILTGRGFEIQTKRVCSSSVDKIIELDSKYASNSYIFGIGSLQKDEIRRRFNDVLSCKDTSFNLDLTGREITIDDAQLLFEIIRRNSSKTFNFTYVFNNRPSSPFFPSGSYQKDGFSIGLQPTDLSEDCNSIGEWLEKMKEVWLEIYNLFKDDPEFLGIDSSIAPLFSGKSSLIGFIKKLGLDFSRSATTDTYLAITKFLKENNPKPVGLCGLMFPCLEDFELAEEYEKGNFSIERNVFLSLHSGLGIDTYPIAIDEKPERVLEILKLVQGLSDKYKKPLSARFVSDGKAKIGEKTDFQNQYLKDITVRSL
ncbi:MAG: DUF711 family protein [Candidatus Pacebacteria bacterium]|nr:DUF711 family protein [Candidatus Paceibacterota bacterium]